MYDWRYSSVLATRAIDRLTTDALNDEHNEMYCRMCKQLGLEVDCGYYEIEPCQAARLLNLELSTIISYRSSRFTKGQKPGLIPLSDVAAWAVVRRPVHRPFRVEIDVAEPKKEATL